jgi:pyruvate/2-oxoacid:ferredoxin oxidoreductase beta subunit
MSVQPQMPKLWRRETKPHKFCPGCGHPLILKALAEAVDELNIQDHTILAATSVVPCCHGIFSIWILFKPTTAGPPLL